MQKPVRSRPRCTCTASRPCACGSVPPNLAFVCKSGGTLPTCTHAAARTWGCVVSRQCAQHQHPHAGASARVCQLVLDPHAAGRARALELNRQHTQHHRPHAGASARVYKPAPAPCARPCRSQSRSRRSRSLPWSPSPSCPTLPQRMGNPLRPPCKNPPRRTPPRPQAASKKMSITDALRVACSSDGCRVQGRRSGWRLGALHSSTRTLGM
jgi:hypothetical protein